MRYEEEANLDDDCDTCDMEEIRQLFPESSLIAEKPVALNDKYILHIAGTQESSPNVAVSLSENCCDVYNLSSEQFAKVATLTGHADVITEVKFNTGNSNLIYTGCYDGSVRLWDLRTPNMSTVQFKDTTVENGRNKQITSFDVSPNNRLLSAGTNLWEGDAFILFWDVRQHRLLGGYWESHTDDITQLAGFYWRPLPHGGHYLLLDLEYLNYICHFDISSLTTSSGLGARVLYNNETFRPSRSRPVKFHPQDSNKLISGSTDGLINLYDLSESKEEDALTDSFNTESSIEKLGWTQRGRKDTLTCITHTADVQFWTVEDVRPYYHLHRRQIADALRKKSEDYIYVVDVHEVRDGFCLLAGSNRHEGECLRGLSVVDRTATPVFGFAQNKQRVRSSWLNPNLGILLTGGEKGILNAWKVET